VEYRSLTVVTTVNDKEQNMEFFLDKNQVE